MIAHVTAVSGNDQEAASEAIANCDIMATAVGARILKFIVPNIVAGLRKRWARTDAPLNIIICENLNDANKILEGMLKEQLSEEEKALFDARVGLIEASMVLPPSSSSSLRLTRSPTRCSCSAGDGENGSRGCTGKRMDSSYFTSGWSRAFTNGRAPKAR